MYFSIGLSLLLSWAKHRVKWRVSSKTGGVNPRRGATRRGRVSTLGNLSLSIDRERTGWSGGEASHYVGFESGEEKGGFRLSLLANPIGFIPRQFHDQEMNNKNNELRSAICLPKRSLSPSEEKLKMSLVTLNHPWYRLFITDDKTLPEGRLWFVSDLFLPPKLNTERQGTTESRSGKG